MFKHCVIVFLVSMVPLIELRGAIPYGVVYDLPLWLTYIIAIAGNMLPVPIIYLFARRVLLWGKDKKLIGRFFAFCLEKGEKAGRKLQAKAGRGLYWALLLFVGIPLPGTGAWTGTLAASLLDMDFKKACWPAWAACCWPASSWAPSVCWVSASSAGKFILQSRTVYGIMCG